MCTQFNHSNKKDNLMKNVALFALFLFVVYCLFCYFSAAAGSTVDMSAANSAAGNVNMFAKVFGF